MAFGWQVVQSRIKIALLGRDLREGDMAITAHHGCSCINWL